MEGVDHIKTDSIEPCNKRKRSLPESNADLEVKGETFPNVLEESSTLESRTMENGVERTDDPDKISLVKKKTKCNDQKIQTCDNPSPERNSEEKNVVSDLSETKNTSFAINGKENVLVSLDVGQSRPLSGAHVGPLKKKLIILDINGMLADIIYRPPNEYEPDTYINGRAVFKRPFCSEFLKFCFERFEVGVWSSRTKRNVDKLVDYLLGDLKSKLLFCWDQSQCTVTGFSTLENRHKSMIFKELRKIWEKQEPNLTWESGYFNKSNTLLLDDTPYKALLNPPHTAVFPYSYKFEDTNDNLLAEGGDLRVFLERFYMAEDVQKYVEQHPFGQIAITEQNASWPYYNQIVSYFSTMYNKSFPPVTSTQ